MYRALKSFLFLVTLLALTFGAVGATPAQAALPTLNLGNTDNKSLQFSSAEHALEFTSKGMSSDSGAHALRVDFLNANQVQPQAAKSAIVKDANLQPLTQVVYPNLWDGITLTYSAKGIYTTTYTVAPHADVSNIQLRYNTPVTINKDGTLTIAFKSGFLTESAPIAWQMIDGKRVNIDVRFLAKKQTVKFVVSAYDSRYTLIIDPTVSWHTIIGGSGSDGVGKIDADNAGNIYTVGNSDVSWGTPIQAYAGGSSDVFVSKLSPSGNLLWNTFVGGSGTDYGYDIAVDATGYIYISGIRWGFGYFVAKLDANGNLIWNRSVNGTPTSLLVDNTSFYIVGSSSNWGTPVRSHSGGNDAFAAKYDISSGNLIWNTFLGASTSDDGFQIEIDSNGNTYVTGRSSSSWGSPINLFTD